MSDQDITLQPPEASFSEHFERSVQLVRGGLTDLLTAVKADPSASQDLSRRFGVNRNLAWKVCKIVNTPNPYQVPQHLPGAAGFEIFFKAMVKGGASSAQVDEARAALVEFEFMTRLHAGDRPTLERMLGSMRPERVDPPILEAGRRSAYEGNSSLFGVQARVRSGLQLVAPSREFPGTLDVSILGALYDFQRLRPDATWPLTQEQHASDDPEGGPRRVEPIDPAIQPGEAPLLQDFCSGRLPDVRTIRTSDGATFELREGPVGNTAAMSFVFGWTLRGFGRQHAIADDSHGEYFLRVNTPAEHMLFDVLLHRDLPFRGDPEFDFYSLMQGRIEIPLTANRRFLLPRTTRIETLGQPPVLSTPLVVHQEELARRAADRLGCGLDEFRGYRLSMSYPPIPTLGVFHYPLPDEG